MKKALLFVIFFISISAILAQPQKMTYQAVVRDNNNELVGNQQIGVMVTILEDNANGPIVYWEMHTPNTNANALFSIVIGTGIHPYPNTIADVKWDKHDHYLRVDIDPAGGTNYTISGIQQLITVPYAFYAGKTAHVDSAFYASFADSSNYNNLLNKPTGTNNGDILYWDTTTYSWHILPIGNIGDILTIDSNNMPHWSSTFTPTIVLPTITTDSVFNLATNSARVAGTVTSDGGAATVLSGICWSTSPNPTTADLHVLEGVGIGSISSYITGLTMGMTYYTRAYAINSAGTSYGNAISFTTLTPPSVTTNSVTNITNTTAVSGGNVTNDGGSTVISRGIVWNSIGSPDIYNYSGITINGTGLGIFTDTMKNLTPGTKYYVRAYATNAISTSYGQQRTFTANPDLPTVITSNVSSITNISAISGGNVTNSGGATVTARGICYNTTGNPTITDNIIPSGSGTGSFTSSLTGLNINTTYYVRAYATNSAGTAYGNAISFTTLISPCGNITTVSDYDGNIYNAIGIGSQCWMKENLKTTHYSNSTPIALGSGTSTTDKYRYYPGNDVNNVAAYGYLYNWAAVMNGAASTSANPSGVQGICPTNWHVPSDAEWTQLTNYVSSQTQYWCGGTSTYIAKALANTTGWNTNSSNCAIGNNLANNNATGFSAMPAGMYYGSYAYFGSEAYYCCSTAVYLRNMYSGDAALNKINRYKYEAYSVRCVKD